MSLRDFKLLNDRIRQVSVKKDAFKMGQAIEAIEKYTSYKFDSTGRKVFTNANTSEGFLVEIVVNHIFDPLSFSESGWPDTASDCYILCWCSFSDMIIIVGCLSKKKILKRGKIENGKWVVDVLDLEPIDNLVMWLDENTLEGKNEGAD